MRATLCAAVLAFSIVSATPAATQASAVPDTPLGRLVTAMPAGTWLELPAKNRISDVYPSGNGHPAWGVLGPMGVVRAWGGGAVGDGKLFVWGGGHHDYGGNEMYAFDLATMTWSRLTDPSRYTADCSSGTMCSTVDGTPTSVHSYDGMEWLPKAGRLWVGGGSAYQVGWGTPQAFLFDPRTRRWERTENVWGDWLQSDYDPVTESLVVSGSQVGLLALHDGLTGRRRAQSGKGRTFHDVAGALDFDRRVFVALDIEAPLAWPLPPGALGRIPYLQSNSYMRAARVEGGRRVAFHPPRAHRSGIAYHPPGRRFAVWNGDPTVYFLDAGDWTWTEVAPPGGKGPSAYRDAARKQLRTAGIYGRWRWLPDYGVFLGYNDDEGRPWVFKAP